MAYKIGLRLLRNTIFEASISRKGVTVVANEF